MKIETKYSLKTEVWRMHENKPKKDYIWSIEPVVAQSYDRGSTTVIRYRFEEHGKPYLESELFETKEGLLQSL